MAKVMRDKRSWVPLLSLAVLAGSVVPLVVLGGSESFTATPYADVIRFEAQGVASFQVIIYDLSGKRLWDSGVVPGRIIDWGRTNLWGERLAYGVYLYQAQGWNAQGKVVFQTSGKLTLLPGDKVQLQVAPTPELPPAPTNPSLGGQPSLQPLAFNATTWYVQNALGVGTDAPETPFHVAANSQVQGLIAAYSSGEADHAAGLTFRRARGTLTTPQAVQNGDRLGFFLASGYYGGSWINAAGLTFKVDGTPSAGNVPIRIAFETNPAGYPRVERMVIKADGKVGIGTSTPAGQLDVQNSANQPALRISASNGTNLIEAYNTGGGSATGLVFRVERATGNVRADGAFYGAGYYTGSADVAEHINVSGKVEPGDVVEIDPGNPRHFRKAQSAFSRLVAGVISTSPGVVLGSNSDPVHGEADPRPVLALAGRVLVKATTENGPISVGDLLVSASKPGYAMRLDNPAMGFGAVIGKALEVLEDGEGLIMMQVTLR